MELPPERLGSFYLGAEYDPSTGRMGVPVTYDSRDLTTHAVILGMTGSGKTGLGIILLEEAALDGVPSIIIDPKGDITNLLLVFPDLRPEDFRPWINPDDARRKGMTEEEYARYVAEKWRKGLEEWGITGERLRALRESADFIIYTPGSESGLPVNVLSSLEAPDSSDPEMVRERVETTVSALLNLLGLDADPIKSREALLLSNILQHHWSSGRGLTIEELIREVQDPPFNKLGVFDLDTFYPEEERFQLAMALNGLLASPTFQAWLEGHPLDVSSLLYTPDGRPRHSIFYLAHLSDSERMFFVTLLLQQVISWMRGQPGTTSLRAILYFDEIFGFMPPVREPPAKRLLLTLLKQARAFGLGLVLVTQNPVDLDYKGLTNAGTWFIGRLQTERDVKRVSQGLREASVPVSGSGDIEGLMASLKGRTFVLKNVHESDGVRVFHTRWAMSYLRGPLTKDQIRRLMADRRPSPEAERRSRLSGRGGRTRRSKGGERGGAAEEGLTPSPPVADPSIEQLFEPGEGVYDPYILGRAVLHYYDSRAGVDATEEVSLVARPGEGWEGAEEYDGSPSTQPPEGALFSSLPEEANTPREISRLRKELVNWLYRNRRLTIKYNPRLKMYQEVGESDSHFYARLRQAAREMRDREVDELMDRYEERFERLERKMRRLRDRLERYRDEYNRARGEEVLQVGEALLGYFLGGSRRRSRSGSRSRSRSRSKASKLREKMEDTEEDLDELRREVEELRRRVDAEAREISEKWDRIVSETRERVIKPRKRDIEAEVAILWRPRRTGGDGNGSE